MDFIKRFSDVCILTQLVTGVLAIVAQAPDSHETISGFQFLMFLFFCIFAMIGTVVAGCLKNWKLMIVHFLSPLVVFAGMFLLGGLTHLLFN